MQYKLTSSEKLKVETLARKAKAAGFQSNGACNDSVTTNKLWLILVPKSIDDDLASYYDGFIEALKVYDPAKHYVPGKSGFEGFCTRRMNWAVQKQNPTEGNSGINHTSAFRAVKKSKLEIEEITGREPTAKEIAVYGKEEIRSFTYSENTAQCVLDANSEPRHMDAAELTLEEHPRSEEHTS